MIDVKSISIERNFKRLIPAGIKTLVLFFLTNRIVGRVIKKLKIHNNLFGGRFNYELVSDIEAAKIFWGVWESAEIRFSKRFANTSTIIELGSSVGVTLGVLSSMRQNRKFICVEASKRNFEKLSLLLRTLPENNTYSLVNKAIAYGKDFVGFDSSSTTGSKIDEMIDDPNLFVPAITLSCLLNENQVFGTYTLITDIEGAEAEIFYKDESALKNCVCIIAELEDAFSHTIEEQIEKLLSIGFCLTERYGNVVVFSRI
jgi:FkbM family methyltransferase